MKPEVRTALEGSIRKWEAIADGTGLEESCLNCPLCIHFQTLYPQGSFCVECPVRMATGQGGCLGTPYEEFANLPDPPTNDRGGYDFTDHPEHREIALREVAFLKSLRPKENEDAV